jgi:hypothetical protein
MGFHLLLFSALLLSFTPHSSEAFMFRKIVYCSPVEGVIHWQGKPLANVIVRRELHSGGFQGGMYSDSVLTQTKGSFQLPEIQERRLFRPDLLSTNPMVVQSLTAQYEGRDYLIWTFNKTDFNAGSESTNGILKMNCDISKFEEGASSRIVDCTHNGVRRKYE